MSDPETSPVAAPDHDDAPPPPQQGQDQPQSTAKNALHNITFSIWPPSQHVRDAVVNRLIETLSTPSVLSKRYGTMSPDEASAAALQIEDEAFAAASSSTAADIEILQVYSKAISKRMLDTVKARPAAGAPAADEGVDQPPPAADDTPSPAVEETPAADV